MFQPIKICNRIIEFSFYLLLFLVPLIMTPWNYELFEFNKILAVYSLTTIIISAWLAKMVITKKIIFQRSFWDIPLIIFFLSQSAGFNFWPGLLLFLPGDFVFELLNLFNLLVKNQVLMLDQFQQLLNQWRMVFLKDRRRYLFLFHTLCA